MNESATISTFNSTPDMCGQCVVLVGGMGTRLGSLVDTTPKPMLDIGGEPFLVHLLRDISRFGFTRFLLLTGYRAEVVGEYFAAHQSILPPGTTVETIVEPQPLGTGGALKAAAGKLDEFFLLCNGDSICICDISRACRPFRHPDTMMRMLLRTVAVNSRYGEVSLRDGRVAGFRERTDSSAAGLMNVGIYGMKREILNYLPEGKSSLEADVFPVLAAEGRIEGESIGNGYFIDIGIPEDLARAKIELVPSLLHAAQKRGPL